MSAKEHQMLEVEGISKRFKRDYVKRMGALGHLTSLFSGEKNEKFYALRDISFSASSGENVGLIGSNGSGKTTLLRVIAGIYWPDSGHVRCRGDVIYASGFTHGLAPKLSMVENIYNICSLYGLKKSEITDKLGEIIEFSDLSGHEDMKVYQFSQGMVSRLTFSTTIHCLTEKYPEILLLDEVFSAGGDLAFQSKSIQKVENLIRGGATVIMASHSPELIKKYCKRTIWLENGAMIREGPSKDVVGEYVKQNK